MKQVKVYSREYVPKVEKDKLIFSNEDTIHKDLSHKCLSCRNEFLWYENNSLYVIHFGGIPKKEQDKYTRKVVIQSMLPADLPKELSDLLEEKGFKEELKKS